jgi:hypothetical protein
MLDVQIVLGKVEASYGTDAAPTPAADAHIVYDWAPKFAEYDNVVRKIDRGFPGRRPQVKTRGRQRHPFKVELSGSGAALTPTKWGSVWLRGAMFGAPTVGVSDVSYPLETVGDGGSFTLWGQKGDGSDFIRGRAQGCRTNAQFVFEEGDVPYIGFDPMGLLTNLPDDTVIAAPTLPTYPAPVEVNTTNTAFSLGGFAGLLRSLTLDLGLRPLYRSLVGQRQVIFDSDDSGDRRAAGGELVIELPDPSVRNYFADIAGQAEIALSLVHGTAAGNIVELTSSRCVLDESTFSVENRRLMMSCPFLLIPSSAGNEFALKTR